MLVACFRNAAIPTQYMFQGTRYTDASNSAYKKIIISKNIPLCARYRLKFAEWLDIEQIIAVLS